MAIRFFFNEEEHKGVFLVASFILGILTYFSLSFEPKIFQISVLLGLCFLLALLGLKKRWGYFLFFLFLFVLGVFVATLHTAMAKTFFLKEKYTDVTLTGEVSQIDKRLSTAQIVLENVYIDGLRADQTPQRIKMWVSLESVFDVSANTTLKEVMSEESVKKIIESRGKIKKSKRLSTDTALFKEPPAVELKKGDVISGRAFRLTAPQTPFFSGGYYQAREFFFENIGAVGAFSNLVILKRNEIKESFLDEIRKIVKEKVDFLNQDVKGVVLALVLGEKHLLTTTIQTLYRRLGLTHILSVSGFHISLIAGLIYMLIRFLLTMVFLKTSSSGFFVRRLSAVISLFVTFCYVLISGAEPPAVRAFIMIMFLFACFFINRKVISVRTISLAAFGLLCYKPILILNVGFQLSFIAVLSLCVFVKEVSDGVKKRFYLNKFFYFLIGLILLNVFVTFATTPFIGYHFHKIATYGIIGNLLLSFVFSLIIMPLLVLSVFLMPLGIEKNILKCVEIILDNVHLFGEKIASLPHAELPVVGFASWGLLLFAFGFIMLSVFKGKIRYVGLLLILMAPFSYFWYPKKDVVISNEGRLIIVREDNKIKLNESYRHRFISDNLLLLEGILPKDYSRSNPFNYDFVDVKGIKIAFSPLQCRQADITFEVKKGDYSLCPNLYSKENLIKSGTIGMMVDKGEVTIEEFSKTDKNRPWGFND